ncbi:MAG: YdcF family protein [bacterium]|nr:MAG: YdcF family protein [bacterium]
MSKRNIAVVLAAALSGAVVLTFLGVTMAVGALVRADEPARADAVVVLFHDTEIYLRMTEAARLYREGYVPKVVINGGRVHPVLKEMEAGGFSRDWRWEEEYRDYLRFLGVPLEDVIFIQVEDSFDSWGEATYLGERLRRLGMKDLIITTNKYHSRRAGYVWERLYGGVFGIRVVPVRSEPFSAWSWWREGRQFKWTLYELGSWIFLLVRSLTSSL